MLFKKKDSPTKVNVALKQGAKAKAPQPANEIVVKTESDLRGFEGGKPTGTFKDGSLDLEPLQCGISQGTIVAKEGDVFEATATVELLKPATNGGSNGFLFGPLFYDDAGGVVKWWPQHEAMDGSMPKIRSTKVIVTAPPGSALARVGIMGSWTMGTPLADFVIRASAISLRLI